MTCMLRAEGHINVEIKPFSRMAYDQVMKIFSLQQKIVPLQIDFVLCRTAELKCQIAPTPKTAGLEKNPGMPLALRLQGRIPGQTSWK